MRLRPMRMDDAGQVLAWRNAPHVSRYMFTTQTIAMDAHVQWLERTLDSPAHQYWVIEHNDVDLGVANLTDIDLHHRRCAWAFYLGAEQTPGPIAVAVELAVMGIVFGEMQLDKLISEVLAFNDRVVEMHERAGFVREGVLRDHIRRSDGVHDVVVLSMLRREWQERHETRWRKRNAQR